MKPALTYLLLCLFLNTLSLPSSEKGGDFELLHDLKISLVSELPTNPLDNSSGESGDHDVIAQILAVTAFLNNISGYITYQPELVSSLVPRYFIRAPPISL